MADFSINSYELEDSALNFGGPNDLHESVKLLSLRNDELVSDAKITSLVHQNMFCLGIDRNLWIIQDLTSCTPDFTHAFNYCIEAFKISDNLLLVGLSNGRVHLINTVLKEAVGSCCVMENDFFGSQFFIGIYDEEVPSGQAFLVLTKRGKFYRITFNVEDLMLHSELVLDLEANITTASFSKGQLVAAGNQLFVYDMLLNFVESIDLKSNNVELKNLWPCNESTYIGLKSNGTLCLICPQVLLTKDMDTTEEMEQCLFYNHSNASYMYYVTSESKLIKMAEFTDDGKEIFNLELEAFEQLVFNPDENENQLYLTREAGCISLHAIRETKPEDRLQRLIRKMRYEEAEAFAEQYNLSRMDIDKAMVTNYLENGPCSDADVEKLLALLRNISDVQFQARSSQDAVDICESFTSVEKIIDFILGLKIREIKDHSLEIQLHGTVTGYTTFKLRSRSEGIEMNMSAWKYFLHCDVFEYLISMLRKNKLESAIIIYPRLKVKHFTPENIVTVLGYLESRELQEFTLFMYTMIPTTLRYLPAAKVIFVETIIEKVHALERRHREIEFPEKSIEFVGRMLKILDGDAVLGRKMIPREDDLKSKGLIESLVNISKCLDTILQLKNNYEIFLSLENCLAGPGAMLHALLGLKIKDIEKFLKNFLITFMMRNGFDADNILAEEIGELLKCHSDYWAAHVPQVWRCINSTGKKLALCLNILKEAPKPLCADIRQMLAEALEFNHPLVTDIQFEAMHEPMYIVMYRAEYLLRKESIQTMEVDMFVIHRIISCNLPTLIDDVYTLCSSAEKKSEANTLLVQHFIEMADLWQVLGLINRFTPEEAEECLVQLLNTFSRVNRILEDATWRRTLIKTLDYLTQKASSVLFQLSCNEQMIDILKIIDVLPEHLVNMEILNKLHERNGRNDVLNLVVDDIALLADDFDAVLKCSKQYAQVFRMPHEKLLFQVSQIVDDVSFLYKTALEVYANSEDVDTLSLIAVFIMRSVGLKKEDMYSTFFNDTIQSDDAGKPVDEKQLQQCLALAMRIIPKANLLSGGDLRVSNVFRWMLNAKYLTGEVYHVPVEGKTPAYFPLCGNASSMCTLTTVYNIFNMYCEYLQTSAKGASSEYLTYRFPRNANESMTRDHDVIMTKESFCNMVLKRVNTAAMSIKRENHHFTLMSMLVTLQVAFALPNETEINEIVQSTISKIKGQLLSRVFAAERIDDHLTFSFLLTYPRKKGLKIINDAINTYKLNFSKFESLNCLGKRFTTFYNSTDHYNRNILGIKWRHALSTCKLSLSEFFFLFTRSDLLSALIMRNEITFEQVISFCTDFEFDAETYYLMYLNNLISTWKPTYKVEMDSMDNRTLVVLSKAEDLTAQCLSIVGLIKDRDAILKCVDSLWKTMNFYYYEVYTTILTIAKSLDDSKHMHYHLVLQFLTEYIRTEKPCPLEVELWYLRFTSHQSLDEISEFRFPFSPVLFGTELWNLLRYEVSLSNYVRWFEMVGVLSHLSRNDICSYVIKNVSFVDEQSNAAGDGNYNLQPKFKDVLGEVEKCLMHITDPFLAASMAFHLMHKPPKGADRVISSKLAYKYANTCKEAGIANPCYQQIEKLYFTYASEHILHLHNLAMENYLIYLDDPHALIDALYSDDRILNPSNSCPNINKAVDELGELFGIDMREKRKEVLNTWIKDPNSLMAAANQSIILSPDVNDADNQNIENVLRAAYLCTNDDIEYWRDHLHNIMSNCEQQYLEQGRALKTMCMITSREEFNERYTDMSYSDLLELIDALFVLHDIRSLGIPIDLEQFYAIDKNRLLHKVGKNISDPLNVRVMIALCEYCRIFDLDVWERIMDGLIKLNMISELKKCIKMFMENEDMTCGIVYVRAWQIVVDSAFETLESNKSHDIDAALINLLHFVQSSPVLVHLDLTKGLKACMILKKHSFALLLLQYVPDAMQYLPELLRRETREDLLTAPAKLREMGFISLAYVSKIIQNCI